MTSPFGHASQAIAKKETQAMWAKLGSISKEREKKRKKKSRERNIVSFASSSVIPIPGLLSFDISVSFNIVYFVELKCCKADTPAPTAET